MAKILTGFTLVYRADILLHNSPDKRYGIKGKVKNFQIGICSIFVILAMIMACFNLNEIYSSIMILSGMMMVMLKR